MVRALKPAALSALARQLRSCQCGAIMDARQKQLLHFDDHMKTNMLTEAMHAWLPDPVSNRLPALPLVVITISSMLHLIAA
jgi:hypothetical protein